MASGWLPVRVLTSSGRKVICERLFQAGGYEHEERKAPDERHSVGFSVRTAPVGFTKQGAVATAPPEPIIRPSLGRSIATAA